MRMRLTQSAYRLRSGELISLVNGAGYELACHQGVAWITMAGERQDIWLHAGQRLVLPGDAKIVIEGGLASGEAHVSLQKPATHVYRSLAALYRRALSRVAARLSGRVAATSF